MLGTQWTKILSIFGGVNDGKSLYAAQLPIRLFSAKLFPAANANRATADARTTPTAAP